MDYQTYLPQSDLKSLVKCYWTLEVDASHNPEKQRIIPDGCIEMAFVLGDDIKRYISENDFILQPRAMVLGQTIDPFYIEPTGYVNTFAVRFYPYGFSNFITTPIKDLANKETPLGLLFGAESSQQLEKKIIEASDTETRIKIVEQFLRDRLSDSATIDNIVVSTVDALLSTKGNTPITTLSHGNPSKRRQLERKFLKQIGMSPKQLSRVIRLQAALKMILNEQPESLTQIAYESEYYDQAHFIKDFKAFTGTIPKDFWGNGSMALSALFYAKD